MASATWFIVAGVILASMNGLLANGENGMDGMLQLNRLPGREPTGCHRVGLSILFFSSLSIDVRICQQIRVNSEQYNFWDFRNEYWVDSAGRQEVNDLNYSHFLLRRSNWVSGRRISDKNDFWPVHYRITNRIIPTSSSRRASTVCQSVFFSKNDVFIQHSADSNSNRRWESNAFLTFPRWK